MKLPFFTYDVFTSRSFAGNPLAIDDGAVCGTEIGGDRRLVLDRDDAVAARHVARGQH